MDETTKDVFLLRLSNNGFMKFYNEESLGNYLRNFPGWYDAEDIEVIKVLTKEAFNDILKGE